MAEPQKDGAQDEPKDIKQVQEKLQDVDVHISTIDQRIDIIADEQDDIPFSTSAVPRYGPTHIGEGDTQEYPLQVYLEADPDLVIRVRSGRGVWVQGYPAEQVHVNDPTEEYTPVGLPDTGYTILAVKLAVPHSSDVATWSIYTGADETPNTVYGKTTSGEDTMERYWPLAKVDSDGRVTSYWPGGDILAMRSG